VRPGRSSAVWSAPGAKLTPDPGSARFQIVSNLSHELRGPLQVLNGYLEILAEDWGAEFSGEPRRMLERLRHTAEKLTGTVETLLEYTAASVGTQPIARETVELGTLFAEIKPAFDAAAKRKKIFLVWRIEPRLRVSNSDPRRLHSIISNLVSNAIKFTNRGGVTIRLRRIRHRGVVELSVADTGIGIDGKRIEDAFAPFVQLSSSNSRDHQGLGLGLALVRENVKMLGGTLEVKSKPGAGTRFTVRFTDNPQD
jgi:signal transduction histidine kinase